MIPGEVDQYRNVTVGSCILAQPAIWSLICVTDTFLRTTNLCRRGTFSRDNIISRHLTLSCPPPCVSPVQVHLCNTVSHCVTPVQVHLCNTVSLPFKSICVTLCHTVSHCVTPVQVHCVTLCHSRPSPSVSHCVTPVQVHLCHIVSLQPKAICVTLCHTVSLQSKSICVTLCHTVSLQPKSI